VTVYFSYNTHGLPEVSWKTSSSTDLQHLSQEVVGAATKVQATFRGTRDREWLRQEKLRKEEAATKILGRVEIEAKQNTLRDFCSC